MYKNYKMPFGKYKGKDALFVRDNDFQYYQWFINHLQQKGDSSSIKVVGRLRMMEMENA